MKRIVLALAGWAAVAGAQGYRPPEHRRPSPLLAGATEPELRAHADAGATVERGRGAGWSLAEHRRLNAALAAVAPQRRGVVDAFVVVAALDSDPVFGREARAAAKVLARRYGAETRTILLAGSDGRAESTHPMGSPAALGAALARVAEAMDPAEDVLVLYTTSHGAPFGIVYADGDAGHGTLSPGWLWRELGDLGVVNRLVIVSACYSGVFVPVLASDATAIVTASSADRTSFGCQADNDWTFFGDALVNRALRRAQPLEQAIAAARTTIGGWETDAALTPSQPQAAIGTGAARWLAVLERRVPDGGAPVGRPSIDSLDK